MKSLSNKRDVRPVAQIAPAFVHTMYFDLKFNYTGGRVEQTFIVPVIHDPIIMPLPNNMVYTNNTTIIYLEESLGSLLRNIIASERETGDYPPHLQELIKEASKKKNSGHNRRKAK